MKSPTLLVTVVLAGCVALAAQPGPTVLVVTGGRVLDVATGRTQPAAAVVVEEGRITAIQADPGALPSNVRTVDAAGLTMVPGLVDLAVDAAPSPWIDADYYYDLGLAHGITTYRLVDGPLAWSIDQRRRAASLDILAPRLVVAGPGLELRSGADEEAAAVGVALDGRTRVATIGDLEREIARQGDRRPDWIHLGPTVGADAARAAVAAAKRVKVRVSAEPGEATAVALARAGVDAILGLGPVAGSPVGGDPRQLARELAGARSVLVPMLRRAADGALGLSHPLIARELEALPRRFRDDVRARIKQGGGRDAQQAWRARRTFVKVFASAGGRLAVGSGTGGVGWPVPGLAVHHELQLLVESGVAPLEALRAATVRAASALGADDRAGRIRVGGPADFFGVEGDPAKDIRALARVRLVVRGGEVVDRDELTARAARAASRIR